jgi:hypothetical protein
MKKYILLALLLTGVLSLQAQAKKTDILDFLENGQPSVQNGTLTATLTTASRLFGTKEDLTSVIMIIPTGSTVTVLDSDSTYFHVTFEESEGYIFKRHAVIDKKPGNTPQTTQTEQPAQKEQPVQEQQMSRFSYLENKYGSSMAARLASGKIWKGMNAEMAKDSWGTAEKINRVNSGNIIKEEWIFRSTWLYFENNILIEWGPVKR